MVVVVVVVTQPCAFPEEESGIVKVCCALDNALRFAARWTTFCACLDLAGVPTEGISVLAKTDAVVLPANSLLSACRLRGRRALLAGNVRGFAATCIPVVDTVAAVSSAGGPFACRHCQRLVYASQNEAPSLRNIRRARKIRLRLGGGFSFAAAGDGRDRRSWCRCRPPAPTFNIKGAGAPPRMRQ
jgi:hypothetical protein